MDDPIIFNIESAWQEIKYFLYDILDSTFYIDFIDLDIELSLYDIIISAFILVGISDAVFRIYQARFPIDDDD